MATKGLSKDVKYLNRDFSAYRDGLIEFAKTYFPNTYNDFNESDPGMMFIEIIICIWKICFRKLY